MNTYRYACSEGHWISTPKPLDHCIAFDKGCPCKGELKRVGPGSRKAA